MHQMDNEPLEHHPCVICGTREGFIPISEAGKFGFPTKVVLCPKCALVQLNPRWTAERYYRFYEEEFDRYYRAPGQKIAKARTIVHRIKQSGYSTHKFVNILDIGSGDGTTINHISKPLRLSELLKTKEKHIR